MEELKKKLEMAEWDISPEEYVSNAKKEAVVMAFFTTLLVALFLYYGSNLPLIQQAIVDLLILLISWYVWYLVALKKVDAYLTKIKNDIEYELGFLLKHLVISLKAGMPLYDALVNVSKGYGRASQEIAKVVERTTLGEPLTVALKDRAEKTPSLNMRRVLLQISNAVVSGADIAKILEDLEKQITKEKVNEYKRYGYSLNPLIMLYMIAGIVFPTLAIAFLIIILTFTGKGSQFGPVHLGLMLVLVALIQLIFAEYVIRTRPRYSLFE